MQDNPFDHLLPRAPQQPAAQPRQQTFNADPIVAPAPPSERRAERDQQLQEARFGQQSQQQADDAARQRASSTFRTMTPQEKQSAGLDPNGVYQVNGLGEYKVVQAAPQKAGETLQTQQRAAKLKSLMQQLDRVDELFRDDIEGGFPNPIAGRIPFVPETERFNSATAGAAEQGLSAFRVPGVGAQSDAELRQFVEANRPLATDTDLAIEEKLRQLRARAISELEALGVTLDNSRQPQATPPQFSDEQEPPAFTPQGGGEPPAGGGDIPPDYRLGAGLSNGDGLENPAIAAGEARREDSPALEGVRQEYARRLGEGQTAEEIIRWARSAGINPTAYRSIQEQVRFRNENPGVPIEQYDTTQLDDRFVPLSALEQGVGRAAQNPLGTGLISAANAISGFTLDNIAGALGGNAERARLGMDVLAQQNPVSSIAGTVAGAVGSTLAAEAGLARAGIQAGAGRALAADTAFGAAAGAGSTDDGSSRIVGALQGAAAGAGGSLAGQAIGRGLRNVARGSGDPNVQTLRDAGVNDLTVGQTTPGRVGNALRGVEDRLSGIPVVGDVVNARRTAGLRQFNQAAFKKALEPISGSVGDKVGMEAVEEAQAQVSNAFRTALAGKGATPDKVFGRDLAAAVQGVRSIKRVGDEVSDEVGEIMRPYANDPMLSGEALDDISRNLRTLKANYVASRDPLATRVGAQIDRVERAIFDLFDRQASGTIDEYRKARAAYRRLSTLEDAVLKAQNQPDNVFTAAQLGRADTSNTRKFGGKRAAARGDTQFNELQQAGQAVLPNRVPDSGTAGRLLIPLLAVGSGAGVDQASGGGGTGLTIGAIIAGLYSRTGQRILTKPARGVKPNTATSRALQAPGTSRALGALGAAGALSNQ